ncbi:MAG: efflux RND transporter periplasmic adaptor subunit [Isosphaeraceae bacterium]
MTSRMKTARFLGTSAPASLALVLVLCLVGCSPRNAYVPPPTPPEVTVSHPVQRDVETFAEYTGTTKPIATVDLRARVKGFLKEIRFEEASEVKAGDVLIVIDEAPFQIKVDAARARLLEAEAALRKAEVSKAREIAAAQLALNQAMLMLAQVEERRNRNLLARNAASREDVDRAEAARKRSEAQVESDTAALEQAKADFDVNVSAAKANLEDARAALKDAEINLGYCRVSSPIDGRITRRFVDAGNLVGDSDATVLATVVQANPIYAYMNVSEVDVLRFRERVRKGERVDFRQETIPIDLAMPTETGFPHRGRVDYADPGANPGTGTVQVRGEFKNPNQAIFPGVFVRLRVPDDKVPNALLVPERALGADQAGRFVLVVAAEDKVEQRPVEVGPVTEDGLRMIKTGLTIEDRVVVNGLQRARPGAKVRPVLAEVAGKSPKPGTKPESEPEPEPKAKPETKADAVDDDGADRPSSGVDRASDR